MSGSVKTIVLAVVLVGALGFAGLMFYKGSKRGEMPGGEATVTEWICVKCGDLHKWDGQQLEALKKDPQKAKVNPMARQQLFYCDKCGDFTIVRAKFCNRHQKWYPTKNLQGASLNCPDCQKELDAMGG